MNLSEAYKELNLSDGASPEEAKKAFKKLAAIHHPDNKATGNEAKFKAINEAYQRIQKGDEPQISGFPGQGFSGFSGFPNASFRRVKQPENIEINLTIDFKESVLGCKKELKYSRQAKCPNCNGTGEIKLHNGCTKCGGRGQTTIRRGNMIFMTPCPTCAGQTNTEQCKSCKGEACVAADVAIQVSIPAGILNNNILRLENMGNYAGSLMGMMDQYVDAYCHITVIPEPGLSLNGKDVISNLTISLLNAIKGFKYTVNTIDGQKEIQVPPQSKNNEEVIIPNLGVNRVGNQKVILDVQYPKDLNKLIETLESIDGRLISLQ